MGLCKMLLGDLKGAIADFTKAINIDGGFADAYYDRGLAKYGTKDYYGAISDLTNALKFSSSLNNALVGESYYLRGSAKYYLGDNSGSCLDLKKAQQLGFNQGAEIMNFVCK